jgi:hypothetical protein
MSEARRQRKLERAAEDRARTVFGRVFGRMADRMSTPCELVLRASLPEAARATLQPRNQRFKWFLQHVPTPILTIGGLLLTSMKNDEDEPPEFYPAVHTITVWARMLLCGRAEQEWSVDLDEELLVEGITRIALMLELELFRREGVFDVVEYPDDPWDEKGSIHTDGFHQEAFDALFPPDPEREHATPPGRKWAFPGKPVRESLT